LGKKKLTSADIDEAHDEALSMVKELGLKHLNYSLLTLMAFDEGDSHFKENSLLP
jgi:hypothetical protein